MQRALSAPVLIVANPTSGRGLGRRVAERVADALRAAGADVAVEYTRTAGDGERVAREAAENRERMFGCVAACGGDGTVQQVVNGLLSAGTRDDSAIPALGVVPAGRCNDFARAIGMPKDPAAIAAVLGGGHHARLDLGKVNGRYFCTVATAGIDAEVSSFVDAMRLPLKGTAAYVYGAIRVLVRYAAPRVRIDGDFGVIDGPLFLASSANTSSYGGAIPIAPPARLDDGQLHLCIVRKVSKLRAFKLVPALLKGRHLDYPEVQIMTTRHLTIDMEERMELWADGERVGETPATIEVVPEAVPVVVPRGTFSDAG
jgi:diacylglycerol kinase (ATP)